MAGRTARFWCRAVGIDLATPLVETIGSESRSRFTGRIPKVMIEVQ
jgi:hypothetical protein